MTRTVLSQKLVSKLIKINYDPRIFYYGDVYCWCSENCLGDFYTGVDWEYSKFGSPARCVEFELESDAVLFALRFS